MTKRPFALFRCDGGTAIGAGHIMRCRAFADQLDTMGWNTQFAISASSSSKLLGERYKSALVLPDSAGPRTIQSQLGKECNLLVIDHYGLNADFEKRCRAWANKICVFDDLAETTHDCDLLVNSTPGQSPRMFKDKVPDQCECLLGPAFAPLRPEFFRTRIEQKRSADPNSPAKLLISLGTTDPANMIGRALRGIRSAAYNIEVTVVLSSVAPHKAEISEQLQQIRGTLKIDCKDMAWEVANSDIVLGAGGISAWERCCLSTPTLMIILADNQRPNADALEAAGAVKLIDPDLIEQDIANTLKGLLEDTDSLTQMARTATRLCDGLGTSRLAQAISVTPTAKDGKLVKLRPTCIDDAAIMLEWQRHPQTRRYARNPAIPSEKEHMAWIASKLADRRCVFNTITHGSAPAGILRFDYDDSTNGFEVSILVSPHLKGLGIAGTALRLGQQLLAGWDLYAFIAAENSISQRLFRGNGFAETKESGWLIAKSFPNNNIPRSPQSLN